MVLPTKPRYIYNYICNIQNINIHLFGYISTPTDRILFKINMCTSSIPFTLNLKFKLQGYRVRFVSAYLGEFIFNVLLHLESYCNVKCINVSKVRLVIISLSTTL